LIVGVGQIEKRVPPPAVDSPDFGISRLIDRFLGISRLIGRLLGISKLLVVILLDRPFASVPRGL
jgi:hypothetical protein